MSRARGKKRGLDPCLSRVERTKGRFFKTLWVASQHGKESEDRNGKVSLTWDLKACDRKEFDYASPFQAPSRHSSLDILLVAP